MPEEDLVELKFRLYDGTDIGPIRYSSASTIAVLKERIVAEWPRDKKIVPKTANDVKLINAGKILENNKTVGQCRIPFGEVSGAITMHVVVQPYLVKTKTESWSSLPCREYGFLLPGGANLLHVPVVLKEKKIDDMPKKGICSCTIL